MPPQTVDRYIHGESHSNYSVWAFNHKIRTMVHGRTLRLCLSDPASVCWTTDAWTTEHEHQTRESTLGIHVLDLPTSHLKMDETIRFTIIFADEKHRERLDFVLEVI